MIRPGKTSILAAGALVCALMLGGCATADRKVSVLYQPVAHATGGAGSLYLTVRSGEPRYPGRGDLQWIVGKVVKKDGEKTGDVIMTTATDDLVVDALTQELGNAGFSVVPSDKMPPDVTKGINLVAAKVALEETTDLVKSEGVSRLSISLELWKNGRKLRKLDYQTMLSDFAVKDRDLLLSTLLQKSLQDVMKQAIPEIVKALES